MKVIILTVFVSLLLVAIFVGLFLYLSANRQSDYRRDSLLPLDDDNEYLRKEQSGSDNPKS